MAGSSYGSATTILPLPGNLGARTLLFRVRELAEEDLSRKSEDSKRATDGDALKKDTGTKSATYSATNIDPKHIVGLSTAKGGSNSFAVVPLTGAPSGMF